MATSTFQASISNGMQPSEATQSTIRRAGWPAASIARRIAGMSLTTAEAVSTCTTRIALISCAVSAARRWATAAGSTARRQSPFSTSTLIPSIRAMSPQPTANTPDSSTSTVSPRDRTLLTAASQPPCPLAA